MGGQDGNRTDPRRKPSQTYDNYKTTDARHRKKKAIRKNGKSRIFTAPQRKAH